MFREITGQADDSSRWYSDDFFDLYVWHQDDALIAFQLCYDKARTERAFTWKSDGTQTHDLVDEGDASPGRNMAPILRADSGFDVQMLCREFEQRSKTLPSELRDRILAELRQA